MCAKRISRADSKAMAAGVHRRRTHETPQEHQRRQDSGFPDVEGKLAAIPFLKIPPILDYLGSLLGKKNPLVKRADPNIHTVWLLDNTAYKPVATYPQKHGQEVWEVEVVVCIFMKHGREDVGKFVAIIADCIGLDGDMGMDDKAVRKRIAERVQPFVDATSPSKFLSLDIPVSREGSHRCRLDPSNRSGIISQVICPGVGDVPDGAVIKPTLRHWPERVSMDMEFAAPEGWLIISDVDDTVKRTQTSDPVGILRTTFVEDPVPIPGMPQWYDYMHQRLNPAWFYLSASPYNLYPFLRKFLRSTYPPGTIILREYSWMNLSGFLKSFTQGTQEYKVNRMEKVYSWFPRRRVICIGDSTQSDPEAYAEMYQKHKRWIRAIYIRKVTDVANMEDKNKDERFEKAFKDVPRKVWRVFERPEDMYQKVEELQRKHSRHD